VSNLKSNKKNKPNDTPLWRLTPPSHVFRLASRGRSVLNLQAGELFKEQKTLPLTFARLKTIWLYKVLPTDINFRLHVVIRVESMLM